MVGGKAANLGTLIKAGFDVPQGFVLTTNAYRLFLEENKIKPDVIWSELARIRETVEKSPLPDDLRNAVLDSYQKMGKGRVAVRSSATAEDLPEASFAGQYETSLNIEGEEAVLNNIKHCFASMWTDRAVAYRNENEIPHDQVQLAVVVQAMIQANSAGVLFTINPISESESEMMIESNFGLGESVVSGKAAADRFVVSHDGDLVSKEIATKEMIVEGVSDGIQETSVPLEKSQLSSLSDDQLVELSRLGKSIEELFKSPQDIEWAIDTGGKIHILQSRPVTTIVSRDAEEDSIFWTRGYSDDYWNDPVSPLFYDLLGDQITYIVNIETNEIMGYKDTPRRLLKLHKGHVYFNLDVIRTKVINEMPPFIRSEDVLNYFPEGSGPFGKDTMRQLPFALKTRIMSEIRIMLLDGDGSMMKTNDAYMKWTEEVFNPYCTKFDMDLSHAMQHESVAALMGLADELDKVMMKHFRMVRYGLPVHTLGMNLITNYLLQRWLGEKAGSVMYPILLSGLEHKTTETNNKIFELAMFANEDDEVRRIFTTSENVYLDLLESESPAVRSFMQKFNQFLDDFGDRGFTREPYYPRWRDDPRYVIDALKPLVEERMRDLEAAEKSLARKRAKVEEIVEKHIRGQRYGPIKWMLFSAISGMARTYIGFRENQRFNLDRWITRNRKVFVEIGRRFKEAGFLDDELDVFFLRRREVRKLVRGGFEDTSEPDSVKHLVKERRNDFLKYENLLPPKFMVGSREFDDPLPDSVEGFVGIPASQGVITGQIRILDTISDIPKVKTGEILVVSRTDPGWTPVFSKIGGLVTESGGVLSHGAVVSREFGIPAVTNVRNACREFQTGQRVTVDGNKGIVVVHE
jgi:pyruvate,water dikinase